MIKIVELDGLYCPTPFCDICRLPIDEAGKALYTWKDGVGKVYLVHKGSCQKATEGLFGGRVKCRHMEMRHLPVYLAANMGIDAEKLIEVIEDMQEYPY